MSVNTVFLSSHASCVKCDLIFIKVPNINKHNISQLIIVMTFMPLLDTPIEHKVRICGLMKTRQVELFESYSLPNEENLKLLQMASVVYRVQSIEGVQSLFGKYTENGHLGFCFMIDLGHLQCYMSFIVCLGGICSFREQKNERDAFKMTSK